MLTSEKSTLSVQTGSASSKSSRSPTNSAISSGTVQVGRSKTSTLRSSLRLSRFSHTVPKNSCSSSVRLLVSSSTVGKNLPSTHLNSYIVSLQDSRSSGLSQPCRLADIQVCRLQTW